MLFSGNDIKQGVARRIRDTVEAAPPVPVLTAMLALVPHQQLDHVVASYESSDEGTTWRIVAVAGRAFLTIAASSPRQDWVLENRRTGEVLVDDEKLDARLVPLADIASIQVVRTTNVDTFSDWTFNGQWRLTMRDGSEIDLRASLNTSTAREACDALALHLIDVMRGGGPASDDDSAA